MKIKDLLNLKNITSFIEGNGKYFLDKLSPEPQYLKEQRIYRLSKCNEDCLVTGKCVICKCPPHKKVFVNESCNPDRFPDIMNEENWDKFKKENNLNE